MLARETLESGRLMIKLGNLVEAVDELALWGAETLNDVEMDCYKEFKVGDVFLVVDVIEENSTRKDDLLFVYYILMTSDSRRWVCEYTIHKTEDLRKNLEVLVKQELKII